MSIANKLSYLGTTKEEIREGINKLGGGLSTSNTFRSYADKLDEIYDSLPKVEESDVESATLEGTIKGGLDINLKGNTSQYSTTGKNLLSCGNQTFTQATDYISIQPIQAGTYNLICDATSNDTDSTKCVFLLYNSNKEVVLSTQIERTHNDKSITISAEVSYARFYASDTWGHGAGDTATASNVMVSVNGGDYEPYTNGASPNPDYPQPINVVSGDNEVVVCGSNIFNTDDWYNIIHTADNTNVKEVVNNIEYIKFRPNSIFEIQYMKGQFKENTQYTLALKGLRYNNQSNSAGFKFNYTDGTSNYIMIENDTETTYTLTSTANKTINYISIVFGNVYYTLVRDIQIKEGTDTTYEPYQSQTYPINLGTLELCKIGDYQDYFTKNSGKNLFDESILLTGTGITFNGEYYVGTISSYVNAFNTPNYLMNDFKENTQYTMALTSYVGGSATAYVRFKYTDDTSDFITINSSTSSRKILTSASGKSISYVYMNFYDGGSVNWYIKEFAIFEGAYTSSTIPPYEPYGTGQWCKYNAIGEVVLDGSENWTYYEPALVFFTDDYNSIFNTGEVQTDSVLSNYYVGGAYSLTNNSIMFSTGGRLHLRNDSITSAEDLKTWLSTHNTEVMALTTPYLSLIESETLISQLDAIEAAKSKAGKTNVSQINNDLPFKLDVKAILDWRNNE